MLSAVFTFPMRPIVKKHDEKLLFDFFLPSPTPLTDTVVSQIRTLY